MNFKKVSIISTLVIIILLGLYMFIGKENSKDTNYKPNNIKYQDNNEVIPLIDFLKSISGLKAENIELIDNPVGIKGKFIAPTESILNGVDYFLKHTENDKMENVKVSLGNGYITIKVDYKITKKITTPIEVKVAPILNKNKDLELKIEELKFLDLKISNWIVNLALKTFIKDWFPEDEDINIEFKEGMVIIYKDNFKGVNLNFINVKSTGLNIDMTIDLNTIIKDISSKK